MATPKTMSNRLMTMKFMQRGVASPVVTDEPPNKKQKRSSEVSEAKRYAAAVAAEEQKRAEAVEREAAAKGETKWYLSYHPPSTGAGERVLRVQSAGFSVLDTNAQALTAADSDDSEAPPERPVQGRKSWGKFNRRLERQQNPDLSSSSDEDASDAEEDGGEADEEEDTSDDPTGVKAMIAQGRKDAMQQARAERKAQKKAHNAESLRLAEERRKSKINLNRLSSISGGGNAGRKPAGTASNTTCHKCGEKGHFQRDCPGRGSSKGSTKKRPLS